MPFQKGNKLGIKGRTPSIKTQLKRFEERHPEAYDELMEVLFSSGMDGHSLDAQYVIDRLKGKPKATLGIAEEDKGLLTVQTVLAFRKMMDEDRKQLKEGYIEGEDREEEGTGEVADEEDA